MIRTLLPVPGQGAGDLPEHRRLSRTGQDGLPQGVLWPHALDLARQQFCRNMDELVVQIADHQSCFAGHRGVHGAAAHLVAQEAVVDVGPHVANVVAGVEILGLNGEVAASEVFLDALFQ